MQGLLYACSRCGQPQRGLRVLSDLQQSGVFIPLRTYHQAMGLFIHSPDGVVVVRAGQGSNVQHSAASPVLLVARGSSQAAVVLGPCRASACGHRFNSHPRRLPMPSLAAAAGGTCASVCAMLHVKVPVLFPVSPRPFATLPSACGCDVSNPAPLPTGRSCQDSGRHPRVHEAPEHGARR